MSGRRRRGGPDAGRVGRQDAAVRAVISRRVDLTSCDTEPIHIIGAVQPHGALVAVDPATLAVDYASANIADFLKMPVGDVLGQPLAGLVGEANATALLGRQLAPLKPDLLKPWFMEIGGGTRLECFPHLHQGRIILEFVPFENGPALVWEEDLLRQRIISELIKPNTLGELARASAQILREVTGFDRVMIYRFAADRHGEVIAESTVRPDSFFGMHYPSSDIPDPARRHFVLNVIRTIPDIHAAPVPILTRDGAIADAASERPLDLTYSKLRAVAPVHVEYLGNMGVGASMSISLISNDDLWGLVACHHYGPLHLPWSRFRFCELLGGTISALLQSIENASHLRQSIRAERTAFDIEREARSGRPLVEVIAANADALMLHAGAHGMILRLDGRRFGFGRTPEPEPDFAALGLELDDGVATVEHLPAAIEMEPRNRSIAAGAAYLELSDDGEDWLVFLREEFEQTIKWAGKPEKVGRTLADGTVRLSPRGSFALWSEERKGRSKPFSNADREALRIVRRALFALNSLDRERTAVAAQKEAEAEEARLRLIVLDATRRSSMGELASALAHELNQPLSAVTNYVNACRQELRNYGQDVPETVNRLIDSAVQESSRAANLVRRLRNFIAQGELVAERIDLSQIIRQGVDLAFASTKDPLPAVAVTCPPYLPPIWADPVQIGQVILNLVRNALPAMRDAPVRRLAIAVALRPGQVEVSVRDTGHGIPPDLARTIFEPFHSSTTSGMGIGLSLCRSIVEAHSGRIWLQPGDGGAEFIFSLPLSGDDHDKPR